MLDEPGQNARADGMPRRFTRLLLTAIAASALAACGPQSEEALDVTVIGAGEPALADPSIGPASRPSQVLQLSVAQGLVRFDGRGQIEPGLAERWNVSDDGLSYIFRIATGDWPDGRAVNARDIVRILNRQLRSASRNDLKDALGAVDEIVAMTDRVIEVRLLAPRPNLLQLLAQPEFTISRNGHGTGPFQSDARQDAPGAISMTRRIRVVDDEDRVEHVHLRAAEAAEAIRQFRSGKASLVLGGTYVDLPLVPRDRAGRNALRFDPVAGLFGLAPARSGGPLADEDLRHLLNRSINREALIAALNVPGLAPRTTLLQGGLEGGIEPGAPAWAALPFAERYAATVREGRQAIGEKEAVKIAIALPEGPGSTIIFNRLAMDWRPLGIEPVRAGKGVPADLELVDEVAPSSSPAWFVRSFRCGIAPICSEEADELMDSARTSLIAAQRGALLAEAARMLDQETLFMPIAAPIRWSLVADGLPGFAENIFARHPLSGLRDRPGRERQ
jgi:peptide/nickel transport system substrate-binding protein